MKIIAKRLVLAGNQSVGAAKRTNIIDLALGAAFIFFILIKAPESAFTADIAGQAALLALSVIASQINFALIPTS